MSEKTFEGWMVYDTVHKTYKGMWESKEGAEAPFYRKVLHGAYVARRVRVVVEDEVE